MRYFSMYQCEDEANVVHIPDILQEELTRNSGVVTQVELSEHSIFLNFYEKPIPIVSNQMKKVIDILAHDSIGQPLGLANINRRFELLFWILKLKSIPGEIKNEKTNIRFEDIGARKICKVKTGVLEHVIVDEDMAEAILCGLNVDVEFEEVKVYV